MRSLRGGELKIIKRGKIGRGYRIGLVRNQPLPLFFFHSLSLGLLYALSMINCDSEHDFSDLFSILRVTFQPDRPHSQHYHLLNAD